jgi:4'-phosphopantetheinyl transferase
LRSDPGKLRFCYGSHGKPALTSDCGGDTLHFNLSHCHQLSLVTLSYGREIGVDVECICHDLRYEEIAERFFSPYEVTTLRALPVGLQHETFFRYWTCKDSYIKARGEGLSFPLNYFTVLLTDGEPAVALDNGGDQKEVARWTLQELAPGSGYAAALTVEGYLGRPQCWDWVWSPEGAEGPGSRGSALLHPTDLQALKSIRQDEDEN